MEAREDSAIANRAGPRLFIRWLACLFVGLALLLVLLSAAGAIYQYAASARDERMFPPPGKLVDVGGYRMHIHCIGEGTPTVVMDAGARGCSVVWSLVQPEVAKFKRACAYDRPGYGWSDPSPGPRSSKVIAEELHALLQNAGIAGPYVLVAHSQGALNMRMYASQYSAEIVGIVLVDPLHPEPGKQSAEFKKSVAKFHDRFRSMARVVSLGLPRLMGWCSQEAPREIEPMLRAVQCRKQWYDTIQAEGAFFSESSSQVRATGSLGNMPLVVLSHDPHRGFNPYIPVDAKAEQVLQERHEDLARLSSRGTRIVAEGSQHYIQFDRPELVVQAIRQVVEASTPNSEVSHRAPN